MWTLLLRFWPYLAAAAGLIAVGLYLRHTGYESGYAASEVKWQARFAQAERERKAADEKARRQEEDSRDLSEQSEKQHAEKLASLNLRADAAERRYASLLRQHSASANCGAVRQDGGAARDPDAAPSGDEHADRAGADLARLARRCEADAAALGSLQEWIRGQRAIINR